MVDVLRAGGELGGVEGVGVVLVVVEGVEVWGVEGREEAPREDDELLPPLPMFAKFVCYDDSCRAISTV